MSTFVDLHIIQTVPPSCLNRDDSGSPKTAYFGGVQRHRVSSQAWKRAARLAFRKELDSFKIGVRTKRVAELVLESIAANHEDVDSKDATKLASVLLKNIGMWTTSKDDETPVAAALAFLSQQEIDALADLAVSGVNLKNKETAKKKAAAALQSAQNAIDVALFGRMLADMPAANVDAACQVQHAISVNAATIEYDFFTALDDISPADTAAAAMVDSTGFISSTLYRFITINVDRLVSNLGSEDDARLAIQAAVKAFILSLPSGKQNTFAAQTRPDFVMLDLRTDQPVSLVNAFETPVVPKDTGIAEQAVCKMLNHANTTDAVYGTAPSVSAVLATELVQSERLEELLGSRQRTDLNGLVSIAASSVQ